MVKIGSARADERGSISGGKAGDQNTREVSIQNYYMHRKGWNVIRAKSDSVANKLAKAMKDACANQNIGYDQGQRGSIVELFTKTKRLAKIDDPCECDCSMLVRLCVWQASGKDPGNFTTFNAVSTLDKTGLFDDAAPVSGNTKLYDGDILCTKTKGHIVIVVDGEPRVTSKPQEDKPVKPASKPTASKAKGKVYEPICALNMRSGPGTNHSRLRVLYTGNDCTLLEDGIKAGGEEWYKIKYDGLVGYVVGKYLRKVK